MQLDPRTKIGIVVVLSTMTLLTDQVLVMTMILTVGMVLTYALGGQPLAVVKRLRKMLSVILGIIVLQSLFTRTGVPLFQINDFSIITDAGLHRGFMYVFRVLNILVSGMILATSSETDLITGLVQMKVPYDFAFMVALGIRFMPIFVQEFKETMIAIQLRGINVKALKLKEKIDLYSYMMTPIVVGALDKAKKISVSVEMRGFRLHPKRTAYKVLKLKGLDYVFLSLLATGVIILMRWQ